MYTRPKIFFNKCAIHAWQGRENRFSLEQILKEDIAHLTRITTLTMHVLGMSDIVIQPQAVIDSVPKVWSVKSTFAAASARFFITTLQMRSASGAGLTFWWFDWSCRDNV